MLKKKKDEKKQKQKMAMNFNARPYGGIKPRENLLTRLNVCEGITAAQRKVDEEHELQYEEGKTKMLYEVDDVLADLE
jgi:serine/threonine protein kinase